MKRTSRKLVALLLTMLMILSLFPTAFAESGAAKAKLEPAGTLNGYIPMDYHGSRALTDAYLSGEANGTNATNPVRATLPSSYDSRSYGYITAVKNQNPYVPAGPSAPWPPSKPT